MPGKDSYLLTLHGDLREWSQLVRVRTIVDRLINGDKCLPAFVEEVEDLLHIDLHTSNDATNVAADHDVDFVADDQPDLVYFHLAGKVAEHETILGLHAEFCIGKNLDYFAANFIVVCCHDPTCGNDPHVPPIGRR